jgi:hypothetical protein
MATTWRGLALATTFWPIVAAAPAVGSASTRPPAQLQFFCNTGYSRESCRTHLADLRRVLATVEPLAVGDWTWVLVRSDDWMPILRRVGRDPDSPAFTILEKRQTFLEEALFVPLAGRSATLLAKFRLPLDQLLEEAVLHELGHALCAERDERQVHHYASQLRESGVVVCRSGPSRSSR